MAEVANLDVVRTTVDMLFASISVQQHVFHTQYSGPTQPSDLVVANAIRSELEGALYTVIDGDMSDQLTFVAYVNFNVTQSEPMRDAVPDLVDAGLNVNEALPLQIAALLSFPTATARSIGRKYLGGYTEVSTAGSGVIGIPELARMVTAASNLFGTFTIGSGTGLLGNFRPLTATFVPWTSSRVDSLFRTQRRRVPGIGI